MEQFQVIGEYINSNIMGCKFVGISSDNEVFVEFEHDDVDLERGAAKKIKEEFPEVDKVTVVVKPSIKEVTEMIKEINEFLDKPKDLLDIGTF